MDEYLAKKAEEKELFCQKVKLEKNDK